MKRIFIMVLGLLLIGANVFAGGDLIVNGQLGLGIQTPSDKLEVVSTDMTAIGASPTKTDINFLTGVDLVGIDSYSGVDTSGALRALTVRVDKTGTPTGNALGIEGANYQIRFLGSGTVDLGLAQQNQLVFRSDNNYSFDRLWGNSVQLSTSGAYSGTHTITNYVGFYSFGAAISQTVNGTNWRHAYFADFPDFGGTVANVAGLWIDRQTYGTTNYGIVLNGDGAIGDYGSAIALGANQNAYIYGKTDGVYVYDGTAETKISPHDPETGEWIYFSKNVKTGKVVRVDMARLVKAVEKLTGETFMVETLIKDK